MISRRCAVLATLIGLWALAFAGSASASVPETTCRLLRQTTIDPATLAATTSTPVETYRLTNGKLYITSPDHAERFYSEISELEFGKRYASGHKTLIFTGQTAAPRTQRLLAVHADRSDLRVMEFTCTP